MQTVAKKRRRNFTKISRNKKLDAKIIFMLNDFISKQIDEKIKIPFFFSNESSQLMISCLKALKNIRRQDI